MRINLQNYEEYFVSYLDGELSSQEVADVALFLQQHPELNTELNAFKSTMLSVDEEILFPKKELLKKGITLVNYEDYFIRKVENDLSAKEDAELTSFMQHHQELQMEMNAFMATKLIAEAAVVFPDKNSLKKRDGRVVPMYVRYGLVVALAASLMLIVMMRGIHWAGEHVNSPVAQQQSSSSSPKAQKKSGNTLNEIKKQSTPENSELASNQGLNSTEKNATGKVGHKKNKSSGKENSPVVADASLHHDSNSSSGNSQVTVPGNTTEEIAMIGTEITPISYQAKFKKASYHEVTMMVADKNSSSENVSPMKFTSVASTLGSELLRLSGREDYLKTTSAFNAAGNEKKKLPLVINIRGKKFDFYHTFFRKRNHSSSEPK